MTKTTRPANDPIIQPDQQVVLTAEQLQRHVASQPPRLGVTCAACGGEMLVLPRDNSDPAAIRAVCATCGKVKRFVPPSDEENTPAPGI